MGYKEDLDKALEARFRDLDTGGDGMKVKESAETYKILYELRLAQEKADIDAEFRESEMALKEKAQAIEEAEKKLDAEIKQRELALKEEEAKRDKAKDIWRKLEAAGVIGTPIASLILHQVNFKALLKNEETIHVIPQRPYAYVKNFIDLAKIGATKFKIF